MASLRLGYGDRIAVDDPGSGSGNARARIATEVERYGLLLSDQAPITASPIAPGTARVIVSRMTARVPGCPDYSRSSTFDFNSNTSSNQGCAVNSNLAAMVARPEDLVRGQGGTDLADPAVSTKAIQAFRKAPNSGAAGLKSESATGGGTP